MQPRPHAELFQRGVELFNAARFFDAHEAWEEVWLPSPEPEKTFLQGIIQIAAAFHHYQHANRAGACSLLRAGLGRLAPFPGEHRGIALESLRASARDWSASLLAGADPGPSRLPRIVLLPSRPE